MPPSTGTTRDSWTTCGPAERGAGATLVVPGREVTGTQASMTARVIANTDRSWYRLRKDHRCAPDNVLTLARITVVIDL
jgi:hypothetical protein